MEDEIWIWLVFFSAGREIERERGREGVRESQRESVRLSESQ